MQGDESSDDGGMPSLREELSRTQTETRAVPWYLTPLPRRVERVALRYAWLLVAVNLLGTAFGVWYYRPQLLASPLVIWPVVPDSPLATLWMVGSLVSWRLGRRDRWLHALAFCGNLKFGLWVPFVQLVINDPAGTGLAYYWFLIGSHLGMAAQAFLVPAYAEFSLPGVGLAGAWYTLNDVTDYLIPVVGDFHHTYFGTRLVRRGSHDVLAHDLAGAAAVVLTMIGVFLLLGIRAERVDR